MMRLFIKNGLEDLQSKDTTTPDMLATLESIERQYVIEVQAKENIQPKITSFFKQNNNQNSVNNNKILVYV